MEFKSIVLSRDEVEKMTQEYQWDLPIDVTNEQYPCITDNSTYIILTVKDRICTNILLIKYDKRILNYMALVEKLAELPIDTYYFNSERRLGNKYRMITKLLGGSVIEKDGKYYYYINAEMAVRNICQKYFYHRLAEYKDTLIAMQDNIRDPLDNIYRMILSMIKALYFYRIHISTEQIKNIHEKYFCIINTLLLDLLYSGFNEIDSAVLKECDTLDRERKIDVLIKELIQKKVQYVIMEMEKYADEMVFVIRTICNARLDYLIQEVEP